MSKKYLSEDVYFQKEWFVFTDEDWENNKDPYTWHFCYYGECELIMVLSYLHWHVVTTLLGKHFSNILLFNLPALKVW